MGFVVLVFFVVVVCLLGCFGFLFECVCVWGGGGRWVVVGIIKQVKPFYFTGKKINCLIMVVVLLARINIF